MKKLHPQQAFLTNLFSKLWLEIRLYVEAALQDLGVLSVWILGLTAFSYLTKNLDVDGWLMTCLHFLHGAGILAGC